VVSVYWLCMMSKDCLLWKLMIFFP
jgi:hypothetical protein